jgi:glycosyltransferase involved in cell wall biosynthesis
MRIGIDAWGLSGDLLATGMGQYTRHLCDSLPRLDPDVALIAYASPGEPRPVWLSERVEWRPVGRRMPGKLTALHSRLFALPGQVAIDRIDLFHETAVHMRPFFPPVPRLGCPVVVTLHDLIPMTYYRRSSLPIRQQLFYTWNLRRAVTADGLLTVSERSRDDITAVLHVDPARVDAIHNGVDFPPNPDGSVLERLGLRRPYLLYAGSFEPRKNLAGALRAYRHLVDRGRPEMLVAIVERASGHRAGVMAELDGLGLSERVRLLHSLDEADLRAIYTHAEILLFPSLAEGFGFPAAQAAAVGLPVVASDLPVLREVMADAAVYVDPRSAEAMAHGITSVLSNEPLRQRLRDLGRARAALFTQDEFARRHLDLYAQVLRRGALTEGAESRLSAASRPSSTGVEA